MKFNIKHIDIGIDIPEWIAYIFLGFAILYVLNIVTELIRYFLDFFIKRKKKKNNILESTFYATILMKYINHVEAVEGVDFLDRTSLDRSKILSEADADFIRALMESGKKIVNIHNKN